MPESEPLPVYSRGITTAALQSGYVQALQEEQRMGPIWAAMEPARVLPYREWLLGGGSIRAGVISRFHYAREAIEADRASAKVEADRRRMARYRASLRCCVTDEECGARADRCDCPRCKEWLGE